MIPGRVAPVAVFCLAVAACAPMPPPPTALDEQAVAAARLRREGEGAALERRFEEDRLCEAGFRPLHELSGAGRSVRRATYSDPYHLLVIPGVTLERLPDASVHVSVTSNQSATGFSAPVPPEVWTRLTAEDEAAFHAPPPAPPGAGGPHAPPPVPRPICHGAGVVIEAAEGGRARRRRAHECAGAGDRRALAYASALAEIAVQHIPSCAAAAREKAQAGTWALSHCLGRLDPATRQRRCRNASP